jgi:GrpB-like predicted nucleotidyltransferase (UPF0157 family)
MSDDRTTDRPRIDDALLDAVLVGGREPVNVVIVDYDPEWPRRFEDQRAKLRAALGERVRRIEHIGSTSVPGLAAKPIVDVLVTLDDVDRDEALRADLESAGYRLRVIEPGHRVFRPPERNVNVHVWNDDDPEVDAYLRLRERLRRSPEDRALYEQTKRALAGRHWSDVNYYAEAKGDVIRQILERAEE